MKTETEIRERIKELENENNELMDKQMKHPVSRAFASWEAQIEINDKQIEALRWVLNETK